MVNLSASVGRDRTELSYSCGMCLQKHMVAKGAQNSTEQHRGVCLHLTLWGGGVRGRALQRGACQKVPDR